MSATEPVLQADMLTLNPAAFSLKELRQMIFEGDGRLPKVLALSVLRRKEYPKKEKDFERVMLDDDESPAVRHAAALELGRIGTRQAVTALRKGAKAKHSLVVRGATSALTAAGEAPSLTRKPVRNWPQEFHRYQASAPGSTISFPKATSFAPLRRATEVTFQPALRSEATVAASQIAAGGLNLPLTTETAIALRCGERALMFLPTETLVSGALVKPGSGRQAVAGVVAMHQTAELDNWSPQYYVLCQPSRKRGELEILVTTTTGTVALAGIAAVDGERASFKLRTVKHAGAVPAEVAGAYERGRVRFARIRSQERMIEAIIPRARKR
jgi:hypothetical protein